MKGTGVSWKKTCCVGRHVQQDCPSQWRYWNQLSNYKLFRRYTTFWRWRARCLMSSWFWSLVVLRLICPLSSRSKMWNSCVSFALWRMSSTFCHLDCEGEKKADAEQIKQALITAYATDAFNAYDQFVTWHLCPDETVDKFFAELRQLARLIGGLLPKRWLTCAFVSGLPQHIKHLLLYHIRN